MTTLGLEILAARLSFIADAVLLIAAMLLGRNLDRIAPLTLALGVPAFWAMELLGVPDALCDPIATGVVILVTAPLPLLQPRPYVAGLILVLGIELFLDAAFYAGAVGQHFRVAGFNSLLFISCVFLFLNSLQRRAPKRAR